MLIESFRPGLMARWGLDGDTLRAANPGLVTCSVTAFGTGEAARGLPGYDFLAQAMGGLMSVTGEEDGRPLKTGAAVVDLVCGLLAVVGIQAALAERAHTGTGRHVEVSLMDAALMSLLNQGSAGCSAASSRTGAATATRASRRTRRSRRRTARSRSPSATTACSRGCATRSGCPSWPATSASPRTAPASRTPTSWRRGWRRCSRTRPAAEWIDALRAAAVPAGPINDVAEAFALAESLGMEPVGEAGGLPLPTPPLRLDGERPPIRRPPPGSTSTATSCEPGSAGLGRAPGG